MSPISMSPVTSTSPSRIPPTRRSPSMYSWPISRSRGPSVTELGWLEAAGENPGGCSAGGGVGRLATGLVLKVAHSDVAVEAGAVLDLQPAHLDVSVQLRRLSQRELVAGGELALDLALDGHVLALEQCLHDRPVSDLDVAAESELAFGVATVDGHAAAVRQLAFQAVVRAERELLEPITLGVGLAVGLDRRALRYRLLCFHAPASPRLGNLTSDRRSRVTEYFTPRPVRSCDFFGCQAT